MNGNKVNLSEQHAYWYGETTVGVNGRYIYGLNTSDYLEELESSGYQLPREKIWNYNPSWNIGGFDANTNTYPNSCAGYFGEKCTDFAFQADEVRSSVRYFCTFGLIRCQRRGLRSEPGRVDRHRRSRSQFREERARQRDPFGGRD